MSGFILFIVEKILTTILLSILIFLATLSYSTGKFPPPKEQIYQTLHLLKDTYQNLSETKAKQGQMPANPSLEQVHEMQKLVLRRTELTMALMKQYKLFQGQAVHPEIQTHIEEISKSLDRAGYEMDALNKYIQKMKESPSATAR